MGMATADEDDVLDDRDPCYLHWYRLGLFDRSTIKNGPTNAEPFLLPASVRQELFLRQERDNPDDVIIRYPPDRPIGITRCHDLVFSSKQELGRLNDLASFFPPRAKRVGNVSRNTITDWEIDLVGHFLSFVNWVDAGSDNRNAKLFQLS